MDHVFISYSHHDSEFAENLQHRLRDAGFDVWTDTQGLRVGEDWRKSIDKAIRDALALIVVMTPEAKQSEYVTYEWAFAVGAGVKVIPVMLKQTQLHPRLEALQYLPFADRPRPWDRLMEELKETEEIRGTGADQVSQGTTPIAQRAMDVDGEWVSDILSDRSRPYRVFLDLKAEGDLLFGTLREVPKGYAGGILDGKITGSTVSFHIPVSYITDVYQPPSRPGETMWTEEKEIRGKVLFYGTVSDDEIHFTRHDDLGRSSLIEFTAKARGGTPLHEAVSNGRLKDVERLLEDGANVNARDAFEYTPLHMAVQARQEIHQGKRKGGDEELGDLLGIVKLLAEKGANVEATDIHGRSPLYRAISTKHTDLEVAEVLLSNGADPNKGSEIGGFLYAATRKGTEAGMELVRLLLEAGADPNINMGSSAYGTPLYNAVSEGKMDMAKLLLEAGADVNAVDERDRRRTTPLHCAVSKGQIDMVKLLLEAGADVDLPNVFGYTPLHMAASASGLEAVEITKLLIQKGADVNAKDGNSATPLHKAADNSGLEAVEIVKLLIQKGADVNAKNSNSNTPRAIALSRNSDVAELLHSHGGK